MSLTFAELNNVVDFNIREWAKTVGNRVIIIKNIGIPEKVGETGEVCRRNYEFSNRTLRTWVGSNRFIWGISH